MVGLPWPPRTLHTDSTQTPIASSISACHHPNVPPKPARSGEEKDDVGSGRETAGQEHRGGECMDRSSKSQLQAPNPKQLGFEIYPTGNTARSRLITPGRTCSARSISASVV